MASFYQRLASKLNEGTEGGIPPPGAPAKTVSFKATGERTNAPNGKNSATAPAATPQGVDPGPAAEPLPEGTEPLDIDLFQSEGRVVVFAPLAGVVKEDLAITIDEEENTVTIQATQKRPSLPPPDASSEDDLKKKQEEEQSHGRYAKQEVKWKTLYRKVYSPLPFDSGESRALLDRGILIVVLPAKKPGSGKKLAVKEILDETRPSQPEK